MYPFSHNQSLKACRFQLKACHFQNEKHVAFKPGSHVAFDWKAFRFQSRGLSSLHRSNLDDDCRGEDEAEYRRVLYVLKHVHLHNLPAVHLGVGLGVQAQKNKGSS